MADLSGTAGRRRDRGQLLLVAAFVLSILFVVLALLLNAAAVTALTANTAGSPAGALQGPKLAADTERGVGAVLEVVNTDSASSYTTLHGELTSAVTDWSDLSTRLATTRAGSTRYSVTDTTKGTRIVQRAADRNLTSAGWEPNWTLAAGATRIGNHRLNLSRSGLVDPAEQDTASDLVNASVFRVVVEDDTSSDRWRVFVYADGSDDVAVAVEQPSGDLAPVCRAGSTERVLIDVTRATVGGSDCPALDFASSLDGAQTLRYELGSNATGSYTADVDVERYSVDGEQYGETGSETHPYVTEIFSDATVRLDVVRPTYTYRTSVTVLSGETDD